MHPPTSDPASMMVIFGGGDAGSVVDETAMESEER
jgi:hypothetical protein